MISVELDRPRSLRFGLAAVRDLESAMGGKPLASILQDLSLIGINALVTALYHGLKHEDPTLNPNRILKILERHVEEGNSLQPLYTGVSKALEATGVFRTSEDVEAGKSQTPAA